MTNIKTFNCKYCNATTSRSVWSAIKFMYCSNKCQKAFEHDDMVRRWTSGELVGWSGKTRQLKPFVRRHIHSTRGSACASCGWDEKHPIDGRVLTEINHIDGDAENCSIENLEVLCPNCHAKTHNFRARNKNSKRKRS